MDSQIEGQTDRYVEGQTDRRIDRQKDIGCSQRETKTEGLKLTRNLTIIIIIFVLYYVRTPWPGKQKLAKRKNVLFWQNWCRFWNPLLLGSKSGSVVGRILLITFFVFTQFLPNFIFNCYGKSNELWYQINKQTLFLFHHGWKYGYLVAPIQEAFWWRHQHFALL